MVSSGVGMDHDGTWSTASSCTDLSWGAEGLLCTMWMRFGGSKECKVARGLSWCTQEIVSRIGIDEKTIAK
jgi:hypothetical protein